ncbi:hypothetical protein IRW67_004966 [Salmonella enterica]|nr:hypothetical protein [Salmonella enterica]
MAQAFACACPSSFYRLRLSSSPDAIQSHRLKAPTPPAISSVTRWPPPALRRPVRCVVVKGGFAGRGGELPLADWITILDHIDQLASES